MCRALLISIVAALAGCATSTGRIETLTGYAFEAGKKEDGGALALRVVSETPIGESDFNFGTIVELNSVYTPDALEGHDYDLFEYGVSPLLSLSYDVTDELAPYVAAGWTWTWFDAEADAVDANESNVDVRAGLRWGNAILEYRGTNQDYEADISGECYMHWQSSVLIGYGWEF